MGRFLWAPATVALAMGMLAQTSAPRSAQQAESATAPCVVSGRVVTAASGEPLKSARVALVPEHSKSSQSHIYGTISDTEGRFLLKDVAPGRYQFFSIHAGFVDQQYQSEDPDSGAILALRPGQKMGDVLFRMTVAAAITGHVIDENSEPMAGVQIWAERKLSEDEIEEEGPYALRKQRLTPVGAAQTDDRGSYRVFGLRPGDYYVRAADTAEFGGFQWRDAQVRQSMGSAYPPLYYPGVFQVDQAQAISLRSGEEAQADFSMRHTKTVEVSGKVIGPDGAARNAWVELGNSEEEAGGIGLQSTVDEQGKFTFKGVPSGSYNIIAQQRGEGDKYYRGRQKIEVGGDNIDSVIIALGGGATIRGRVTVSGPGTLTMERIHVMLYPTRDGEQWGDGGAGVRVKKDGTFEITSLKDGSYAVAAGGPDESWYSKSVRIGQDDALDKGVQVEKGVVSGRLEIVMSSVSTQLEGSVTDHDKGVVGARIRVVPEPQTPYNRSRLHTATTDQAGHFLIAGIAPGKYRVMAKSPVSPDKDLLTSKPQIVELSENDRKTLQISLEAQEQ